MTAHSRLVMACALASCAVATQAQVRDTPARPMTGTSTISGTVVAGLTGNAPARRARVMLKSADGLLEGRSATTDDDGRFEFSGLPAGRFTLDVRKPGFLDASYGAA